MADKQGQLFLASLGSMGHATAKKKECDRILQECKLVEEAAATHGNLWVASTLVGDVQAER